MLFAVVLTCSGGGYGLASIFAKDNSQQEANEVVEEEETLDESLNVDISALEQDNAGWEYELDSVVANLDEPGVTRYIRAALILKFTNELDEAEYKKVIDNKKSEMIDWLYTFMAGLSLEEVQGTKNLERFKMQVHKQFNSMLFPDSKPMLMKILTKEFQIQ